jgi:hypothetical protein
MNGTIEFYNEEELANFLRAFCPSTAVFNVTRFGNGGYRLKFTGGF